MALDCNAALAMQVFSKVEDHTFYSSFLETIDENKFMSIKRNAGLQGALTVADIPIKFIGSYDEFKQARDHFFKNTQYVVNSHDFESTYRQYLSDRQLLSYDNCVNRNSVSPGLSIWIDTDTIYEEDLIFYVKWIGQGGVSGVVRRTVFTQGNKTVKSPLALKNNFYSGEIRPITIKRDVKQKLIIEITINREPQIIEIPSFNNDPRRAISGIWKGLWHPDLNSTAGLGDWSRPNDFGKDVRPVEMLFRFKNKSDGTTTALVSYESMNTVIKGNMPEFSGVWGNDYDSIDLYNYKAGDPDGRYLGVFKLQFTSDKSRLTGVFYRYDRSYSEPKNLRSSASSAPEENTRRRFDLFS